MRGFTVSVLGPRPNVHSVFGHRKAFFENALQMDLFENAVFLLSCGRVKTELSKKLTSQRFDLPPIRACARIFGGHARVFCLSVFEF